MTEMEICKELLDQFIGAISKGDEESAHKFIADNDIIFNTMFHHAICLNKFPLGCEFVTDFIVVSDVPYANSPNFMFSFIELERPNLKIFTKAGNPTSGITHALRQINDWKIWLNENGDFFRKEMHREILKIHDAYDQRKTENASHFPIAMHLMNEVKEYLNDAGIDTNNRLSFDPYRAFRFHGARDFLIVAGRRSQMSDGDRIRLAEMNSSQVGVRVITYDALIEGVIRTIYLGRYPGVMSSYLKVEW